MAPQTCGCLDVESKSMPDLEPTIFPKFDLGEDNQSEFLCLASRLRHVVRDDVSQTCTAICAAWAILLECFTGLSNVCFSFESEHNETTKSGRTNGSTPVLRLRVPTDQNVRSLLMGWFSALAFLPDDKAKKLCNTRLSIRRLSCEPSKVNEQDHTTGQTTPPWCKMHMCIDPITLDTFLSWDPRFMTWQQAENISSTYDQIFSEILTNPESLVSSLNYFSKHNERQTLAWNDTPESDVQKCIHHAISEQGQLRPNGEAVCAWDGSFSYTKLLSLSDRLAYRLQTSGVGPEVFVPVCFDKSKWTVVALLAILKAGGCFVPLDPTQPLLRLQDLIRKVEAQTILCSPQHQHIFEGVASEVIGVDDQLFANLSEHSDNVDRGRLSHSAYMIFTSGTTGVPKGALIQHGAFMSSALAHGPAMMMDSNTRSLQFAASTFDASITETLTCLIMGGCVCIPSEDARLNHTEEAIAELQVNWALFTPTFAKFINPANVPSMKTLVTGGEAMTQAVIRSWSHINLINAYGPSEASVVSLVHPGMTEAKNPLNIGHQVGVHCWIVDRYNHDRLMPIGAVGELVIEGQTLAREYYKEPEKTYEAFIVDPVWTKDQPRKKRPRRMYKTGDLVKYNHDGTFHIVGRKDAQIKFHGQRIELGEIEHHINISASIKHGIVVLPKEGLCKDRLLAIVQLSDASGQDLVVKGQPYKRIDGQLEHVAQSKIAETKQLLSERLPSYMIPSMWLAVELIPSLQSGKLDRKQTSKWIDDMTEHEYRQLNPVMIAGSSQGPEFANKTESELHSIWRHVLNLKTEQLGLQQSFLSVGGDSISAMQVMSECKKRGLGLTVSHIISCKSISALALHVKDIEKPLSLEEALDTPFELSPVQKLYFSRPNHALGHFNQSFLFRTSQHITQAEMGTAIENVIQRHSMLRARFSQDASGEWQQRVTNKVTSSYRLRSIELASHEDLDQSLHESQTCLDPTNGPLFAADLITQNGDEQLLFVVAHHLVIDLVSWRIILQELEELLLCPGAVHSTDRPLPFQIWCKMQLDHAESQRPEQALPTQGIPDGNVEYWGLENTSNVYGQMVQEGFEIGPAQTSLLLSKCHESLRTDIPGVLMAAMIYSFGQTFRDRSIPAIFAEGHGRESWDPSIDLSNVVGWFTSIYPVFAGSNTQTSLIDTVKMVKDVRRKIPDNGRPYFASRWLTKEGQNAFSRHWPLEITFNYLGQYQQLEREGALFNPVAEIAGEVKRAVDGADVGLLTTCISLFEISAVIIKGSLRFSFCFSQKMKQQLQIRHWITSCQQNLSTLIESLTVMAPELTLSDFPLLSLTYDRLQQLTEGKLPAAGVKDMHLVEDAYPCSPMQSGLLVSTTKNSAVYAAFTLHEVKSRGGLAIDVVRLADAWKRVVEYHSMLRTIFVESSNLEDSIYDQVVLKEVQVPLAVSQKDTDEDVLVYLNKPASHQDISQLMHRFEICTSRTGRVFCRLDISHLLMDGNSLSILFRDLKLAYDGVLGPEKGPQYRNYIKHLQDKAPEPGIEYWKSYLMGVEPCYFPILNDGEAAELKELRQYRITFDELAQLQSLCDDRGVTIVNAIYAAWALTLRLYTASSEICFGYLTSARDSQIQGISEVVGPVINMVTCRGNISDDTTLSDLMVQVQKDYLESLEYRHTPLAEVQHALRLSDVALFNTALSYRKLPSAPQNPPDIVFEECRPTYDPDEYDVSINIEAGDDDMAIDLMYWSDSLSDGQAVNVASAFTQSLSNVLHHCDKPIGQLDHLGPWHRQQLCQWNGCSPQAIERCIHDLFQEQSVRRPNAPAIASWDMNFTYAELDHISTKLAHYLSSIGVGVEDFVLICCDKSAFTIVAMLAVLKAGGVCVPLVSTLPDTAIRLRAEDTGACIALASPTAAPRFSTIVKTTVVVDERLFQTISILPNLPLPQVLPSNACFVIYTSGSTGRPKGVVLEHRGIATNAKYSGPKLGYDEDSRVLQFASYTFDNSLAEIFTTIILGGCVCVPSDDERMNDLTGAINRYKVTLADLTPTVACLLRPSDVPTLRTLALGGEAVTAKCVDIWRDFVDLRCCYGPSECSVNSTFSGDIAQPGKATNIGRGVGSVTWVVDAADHNTLVPIGCVGELLVDGPIVSRGYLNLPEKMAQAFVSAPASLHGVSQDDHLGRKLYKTGDLVCYNSDGTLTYLGRKDTQVKLNGQRIELGEIEHHVEANLGDGLESAVELVVSEGKRSLTCFISADADASFRDSGDETIILDMEDDFRSRAKDLETLLSTIMPAYMVPSTWFPISKMPLTSSGKLDRRRLRLLAQSVPAVTMAAYKLASKSGRAPASDTEKQLAEMWAQVLNIDVATIGVDDHFFRLGGDSISAMQLVTLARRSDITLTVGSVFQNASLLDMARESLPLSRNAVAAYQPFSLMSKVESITAFQRQIATFARIDAEEIQDIYPCTAIQEGLMALSTKEPGAYVAQFIFQLPHDINTIKFQEACHLVIQAEPMLRTRIAHTEDAGFVQVVVADDTPEWSVFGCLSDAQNSRCQVPLHNGGRLTDYRLVNGSPGVLFVWTVHHAIYDGWCLPIILDKIKQCYQGATPTQLSGPSYSHFIRHLAEIDSDDDIKFWGSHLADTSTQHFPRLPGPDYEASASSLMIHTTDLSRCDATLNSGSGITLATRIRTAWALTVSTYSTSSDVVFWETMTGRDAPVPGIEEMVGVTLATVPTRIALPPSQTVATLLASVQAHSATVRAHQFAGIQSIKNINSDTALACGAQNLLAINYGSRDSSDSFWREQSSEMAGTNFYSYPLMLSCHITDGDIETVVHFDSNVISESQMKRVMDQFSLMFASVSSSHLSDKKLGELSLLTCHDRQLLSDMSQRETIPINRLIQDVIKDQAMAQAQDKLAICAWDQSLTYSELDSHSTHLAGLLVEAGVKVNSIVPFCMEKSSLVIISILAILKAGAAFVPLAPEHPNARIRGILDDVQATLVLCSPQYAERLENLSPKVFSISRDTVRGTLAPQCPAPSVSPKTTAYVIFTSGTTGKPKGTIVDHSAFCTGAVAHGSAMGMCKNSRVLQFASHTFDASIMEMLTTLIHGGTVCVPSENERIHDLSGAINRMDSNWALLTPSVAQLIQPRLVPSLKTLVLGGEAMSSAHVSLWASSVHLMNAYGPSETAVVATVNPAVTLTTSPSNIGRAVGGLCWVVDATNHDRLVPIGVVGELVVEGPILAQGYLKNPQKTAESFIVNPKWCTQFPIQATSAQRRFYKTGDLVKLGGDGTIDFQGRKDNQVKINGQRLELAEIEHYLSAIPTVQYGLTVAPSTGPFKKRLVAVLTLRQSSTSPRDVAGDEKMQIVSYTPKQLTNIRDRLAGHLAAYMIPSTFVIVDHIFLLPSGKLDRKRVADWVANMTPKQHQAVLDAQEEASGLTLNRDATETETKLRSAWSRVLNIGVDKVPFSQSFIHMGGDSISAMQLMAVCRSSDMAVSVSQIMRSKSIVDLASSVVAVEDILHQEEQLDTPFDLSPIQKMYFKSTGIGSTHFNQTIVIKTHSMLRARFLQADGTWSQRITDNITGSYTLRSHSNIQQDRLSALIEESQKSLNIVEGPLFAADIFQVNGYDHQVIALMAHHLVVDVVSWNIIVQDLEGILSSSTYRPAKSISFPAWSAIQQKEAKETTFDNLFHNVHLPPQHLDYWGMQDVPNLHSDSVTEIMEIGTEESAMLSGPCHEVLDTDAADILLASLLASFRQTFSDRLSTPSIFNEGHGREPSDDKLDLSCTVGWFTTLCPVQLPESLPTDYDILDIVRWVRDFRRKLPGKGRPYFAHAILSEHGTSVLDWPVEIAFNFLGQMQNADSAESVLKPLSGSMSESISFKTDVGPSVPRLALIDISASFTHSNLSFSFSFNRRMDRIASIRQWIKNCKQSIHEAVHKISSIAQPQVVDLSLLPLAFGGEVQIEQRLAQMGIASLSNVEAVYPCSSVQQGIYFAQIKDPQHYSYSVTFSVNCVQPGDVVSVKRLAHAWQRVVQRHSSLRTAFVASLLEDGIISQVVLNNQSADISILKHSDNSPDYRLSLGLPIDRPPHRLTILESQEGRVSCILQMSHAICDGTSMPVLFRDLALAYDGSLAKTSLSVCREYVGYLQRRPNHVGYWKDYLDGIEPCYLPSLVDEAVEAKHKTLHAFDQSITLASKLQAFCTEKGVTLSTVFQLAWALVLQAYTGLDDVCFGYLVADRDIPVSEIDQAIGVFINMLICRVRLNHSSPLRDILGAVQEGLATAMNHSNVSLADLKRATGLSETEKPLFNTAYSFQRRSISKSMTTGPISFDISHAQDPNEYDLTINIEVWDATAELQLCYWTDKLSNSQARNIASTFDQVLTSIVTSDSAVRIGELNHLSKHCMQQLMSWNHAEPEFLDTCVHHVFENNVQRLAETTPAIHAWDASLTYVELNSMASKLALHLLSLGVMPDTYIPLCFEKSAWTVVAMMAVLKAGGAFVPIDPNHPPERVNFLVNNVDAKLILCSTTLTHKFESMNIPTLGIDQAKLSQLSGLPTESPEVQVSHNNAAYVIFTSGTTGLPKATVIEHGAFTTGGTAHAKAIGMTSASRVLQFASHTFDASIMEILSALLVGACICIPSETERINDLAGAINKYNVNWTLLTPSVANVLKPGSVPGLKVLVTGGEAMSTDHIAKWEGHASLVNAYGPSEASVIAATDIKVDHHGNVLNREPSTIGKAVGCRSWVVDPRNHNRLMPIGSIGEFLIEGPIVARGYLNNETKTRDAFIQHPPWRKNMQLSGHRVDHMYKTGDLVAYNSDGSLSYVSRKDTQIKLNGQRIELGEIEHHVKVNLPDDIQSAVDLVVPQSKTSTKALAVFFTGGDEVEDMTGTDMEEFLLPMSSPSANLCQSLKTALGAALPSYMVPTIYIPIVKMPWTLAGKLDRQMLKAIVESIPAQQMPSYKLAGANRNRTPTTLIQRKMQKVWGKVLNIAPDQISRDDSFFRLGGDSVGAMKLVAAAKMENIVLTVMDIFQAPILSDMATSCRLSEDARDTRIEPFSLLSNVSSRSLLLHEISQRCGVPKSQITDAYPCSPLQEGLVASSLQQAGAYVSRNIFELPLDIDLGRFKHAWQQMVDQVDILRSRIVNTRSLKSYQAILQPSEIEWDYYTNLESANSDSRPLPDRNGGILARHAIVTSATAGLRYFVWTIHHALYDAWSMPLLLGLASQLYHNEECQRLTPIVAYSNFIKYLGDVDLHVSDEFWKTKFQDASTISHFPNIPSKSCTESCYASLKHMIQYQKNDIGMDLTISTIIRAAWAITLGSQTGSDDVAFGETLSGRDISLDRVGDIIGPTLTTVPSRVKIDRKATIGDFLSTLHNQATQVIPHQHSGIQRIKRLGDAMTAACNFRNLLVIQSVNSSTSQEDFLQPVESDSDHESFFTYPLVAECSSDINGLVLELHYDKTIMTSWQVERIAHQFQTVLQQLLKLSREPTSKLSELQLHGPEDMEMIRKWNSDTLEPTYESISSLFWQSMANSPSSTCIRAWDGHLSYSAVAQNAGRLAKHLVQAGVCAESLVLCCMDKSLWTSVAMLAVILAGGAIVPLDPSSPLAQDAEIAQECNAQVILCSPRYQGRFEALVDTVILVEGELFTIHLHHQSVTQKNLPVVTNRDTAFVIWNYGSAGRSKRLFVDHGSFISSSKAFIQYTHLKSTSNVFHFGSHGSDIAMEETFGALTIGACLCVPSEELSTTNLPLAISKLEATWVFLPPSLVEMQDPRKFKTLETLVCGGRALTPETTSNWGRRVELFHYASTESPIFTVANNGMFTAMDSTNIGRLTHGSHTWIVDPRDHDSLVPVGCEGELLISGPVVSRLYLNEGTRMAESFIQDPAWMRAFVDKECHQEHIRLYKTGSLVKYCTNGSLAYLGRKDRQIKVHGQRVDVGEIEACLESHPQLQTAVVAMPKSGIHKDCLVAIVSFKGVLAEGILPTSKFVPVSHSTVESFQSQISFLQHHLSQNLPPFMVPSAWFVVEAIPILLSGELDRDGAQRWLTSLRADISISTVDSEDDQDNDEPQPKPVIRQLKSIWASFLGICDDDIPTNRSFVTLGGDSIMAMQIMSCCRDESINLTMKDIMSDKSINELATLVETEGRQLCDNARANEEEHHQPFELSPIQQLFFNNSSDKDRGDRFNQSQLLSIKNPINISQFEYALHALVQRHSMLRARFSRSYDGQWTQHISSDTDTELAFHFHNIASTSDIIPLIAASQTKIDIHGPVFIVDLFGHPDGSQLVSLIAHHLVVDIVSWINIIQDLETLLSTSPSSPSKPLSFQRWHTAQIKHAETLEEEGQPLLPFSIHPADLDFWGMKNTTNTYGDINRKSFVVSDAHTVSLLLGDSHTALRTEPLDLFVSALLRSFSEVFTERELPTLFNEGHGREPWDDTMDVSQTVGWFTSLCPTHIPRRSLDPIDVVDCVRRVKDVRRIIPSNGRPYFARRYLTQSGKLQCGDHETMEILLNFLGRTQQASHAESVFSPANLSLDEEEMAAISDVSPKTNRLALFEISIAVINEGIEFTFMYNQYMLHQDRIGEWVSNCEEALVDIAKKLSQTAFAPTLSDFPLMKLDYAGLSEIATKSLPAIHSRFDDVEDIYPCSPMQTGMILSQLRDPSQYLFHIVLEVTSPGGVVVDSARLSQACSEVIQRHHALRTTFIESVRHDGSFDQVVLKSCEKRISIVKCREIDVIAKLNARSLQQTNKRQGSPIFPYQITICETQQGHVYMKLEMNHAVTDGASTAIILRDIADAYAENLPSRRPASYKEYIKYISNQSTDSSLDFWKAYLSAARLTEFPTINPDPAAFRSLSSMAVEFDRFPQLHTLGFEYGVTFSNMIMVAWALVLRSYTNSDDVTFGYLASGRDAPIDGVENIVGPLINMLVFRFQFTSGMLLKRLFLDAQEDYINSLPHQHFSLARVSHALGQGKRGFFNTAVSIQNNPSSSKSDTSGGLCYSPIEGFDPSEYAVTLNANTTRGDEGIVFRYWTDIISDTQAQDLALTMSELLGDFIDHSEKALSHLRVSKGLRLDTASFMHTPEVDYWVIHQNDKNGEAILQSSKSSSSCSTSPRPTIFSPSNSYGAMTRREERLFQKLSELWRNHLDLGVDTISFEDNFFELGGDSIIAMSMVGDAKRMDLPLNVADIFKNPMFASMLNCIKDKSYEDDGTVSTDDGSSITIQEKEETTVEDHGYQPLSLLGKEDPEKFVRDNVCAAVGAQAIEGSLLESRWMLNYFYLDGSGSLDISLLRESITNVVAAYDILRTVFVRHQDRYLQVILRHAQPDLSIHDVGDIEQFTTALKSGHLQAVPKPECSSLRFVLARHKSSAQHRVFIRISHAQYDGICFPAILGALKASYEGFPILPTPSYATYIRGVLGKAHLEHYAHWTALLKNSDPTHIIHRQRNSLRTTPTQVLKRVVSTPSLASLNITTATVVKAAWSTVLAKASGKTDVVFGHLISGRNLGNVPGIETIVGPCLNVVPVRVRYQRSWTVLDLLKDIQNQQVENMSYESLGFREIIDKCTDWKDNGFNGFSTVVQHQSMPQTGTIAVGPNTYQVGVMGSQEDVADFSVVTTPQDANSTEVCLMYPQDGAVERDFAMELFSSLCDTIQGFSEKVDTTLVIS
ncbi:non-ribosomal peptide synthetase [Fusarium austroafricanum]|uniref:Non-ribosomal peptide synthetase n=1 Tax=Fusarium austroafricanum TaxID=2364996 RepID=A0A8H4NJX7_9HYPO|nr:non-ribosomal peptide synthetase [Fusarium austroafricanum]